VGELPGLAEALADDGAAEATYLRRPLVQGGEPPLTDVLVEVLLHLAAESADDPQTFLADAYTWQGQRSIDSRLASLFRLRDGRTVAVGAIDDLLTQFSTTLTADELEVTVTLSDHGSRSIDLPPEPETAPAAGHQVVAAQLGV
jgi:hypothetical protein